MRRVELRLEGLIWCKEKQNQGQEGPHSDNCSIVEFMQKSMKISSHILQGLSIVFQEKVFNT